MTKNVQHLCLEGLAKTTQATFGLKSPTVFTQLSNAKYLQGQRERDKKLSYPLASMSISSSTRDTATGQRAETKMPMYGKVDDSNQVRQRVAIIRNLFTIRYLYVTNNKDDMLDFLGKWQFAREGMGKRLSFTINYFGIPLQVTAYTSVDLTIPTVEYSEEQPIEYEVEGTIELHGYLSNTADERDFGTTPILQRQQYDVPIISHDVKGTTYVDEMGTVPITVHLKEL